MSASKTRLQLKANPLGKLLLWTASLGYGVAAWLRRYSYELGVFKSVTVNTRVICFGNITTGGTGKTTAVILAAKTLAEHGIKTAIISRGYKRLEQTSEPVILSEDSPSAWEKSGDEPFLMHETLREYKIPVVVCPDRVAAAQAVLNNFQNQVLLMDDGFQHYRIYRDTDIVLLDAQNPFGEDALLPLGLLREPLSALSRANAILLTHCDQVAQEKIEETKARLAQLCPEVPVIQSEHQPEHYLDICSAAKLPLNQISGSVTVLSGIGDPDSFETTLKKLKLDLKQIWRYPDHHPYTLEELKSAQALRNGLPLITTYKDFTRFPKEWRTVFTDSVYVLSVHLQITEGESEWLKAIYPRLAKK